MIVAGIDWSLTSPAICIGEEGKQPVFHAFSQRKKHGSIDGHVTLSEYPTYAQDQERYEKMAIWAMNVLKGADMVFIEGYAMGAKGKVFHIAEGTGELKMCMWRAGIEFEPIEPTAVKKFATGKGNATKTLMAEFFMQEDVGFNVFDIIGTDTFNKEPPSPISDIIDAFWIWKAGCARLKERRNEQV